MSGGSFDYLCYAIENTYRNKLHDPELEKLLMDFIEVLHDLEWWQSGDYGEEQYRGTVDKFKKKWLKSKEVIK